MSSLRTKESNPDRFSIEIMSWIASLKALKEEGLTKVIKLAKLEFSKHSQKGIRHNLRTL